MQGALPAVEEPFQHIGGGFPRIFGGHARVVAATCPVRSSSNDRSLLFLLFILLVALLVFRRRRSLVVCASSVGSASWALPSTLVSSARLLVSSMRNWRVSGVATARETSVSSSSSSQRAISRSSFDDAAVRAATSFTSRAAGRLAPPSACSITNLEFQRTDLKLVTGLNNMLSFDALSVDVRSVLAAEIAHHHLLVGDDDRAMLTTDRIATRTEMALFTSANEKLRDRNDDFSASLSPLHHSQFDTHYP